MESLYRKKKIFGLFRVGQALFSNSLQRIPQALFSTHSFTY